MKLPALDVHDETACYQALVHWLHPHGLACPRCGHRKGWRIHRCRRAPVLDYRCLRCNCIFNAWTGTILRNTHLPPSVLWQLVVAIVTRQRLAEVIRATGRSRPTLAIWYRRLRPFLLHSLPTTESAAECADSLRR
jgi:predicted RNA-binding Zn-ribbon protein involved in translation (DUF1610 family)